MKKNIILILSLALTHFYAYTMEPTDDNPMYMQYPEKYEKFKWKVPYGTIKSDVNFSQDVFNASMWQSLAKAISTKVRTPPPVEVA